MSYEYTSADGRRSLTVESAVTKPNNVFVSAGHKSYPMSGIWIANTDTPTVAAELLKAAGHVDLAEYIESAAREAVEKAEAEAAEKKLQERRDALVKKAGHSVYMYAPQNIKTLIAQVVELEDKLAAK